MNIDRYSGQVTSLGHIIFSSEVDLRDLKVYKWITSV